MIRPGSVTIGDYNSFDDFGLVVMKISISAPEPNLHIIEVPGRRTPLDLTESLYGDVTYKLRILTIHLEHFDHYGFRNWQGLYSAVLNAWHGKRLKITLDTDPNHYWIGRIKVSSTKENPATAGIDLVCEVEPYKYSTVSTLDNWKWDSFSFRNGLIREYSNMTVPANGRLMIYGTELPVTPIVKTTVSSTVTTAGESWSVPADTWTTLTGLKITTEGAELQFSPASGNVSVDLREESL